MALVEPLAREPLRRVLVPTDFSAGAERALGRALLLPLAGDARLHIVHVLPADLPARARQKAEADAADGLASAVNQARKRSSADLNVTSELLTGEAFVEIIRCSRNVGADVIAIGRYGRRSLRDMLIGTTAERVIRKGDVPVLAVNLKPARAYRRPVIATDFSAAARRTFDLALRVLGSEVENIDVVHAFSVPFAGFLAPVYSAREKSEYRRDCREQAREGLAAFIAPYRELDVRWKTAVRSGDARSVVLAEAARRRADLIALGTHARSGVAHALLGSVAEWIIAGAPCDVLVARPIRFTFELP
jgi:nucleotide-binding universal stress UspA family protein